MPHTKEFNSKTNLAQTVMRNLCPISVKWNIIKLKLILKHIFIQSVLQMLKRDINNNLPRRQR